MGVFLYGVSALFWLVTLSRVELSFAYPIVSVSYILVAFGSKICFKERISAMRWMSIVIICAGVFLMFLS